MRRNLIALGYTILILLAFVVGVGVLSYLGVNWPKATILTLIGASILIIILSIFYGIRERIK